METFKTGSVHFVFSLRIFVFAHVRIMSIIALGMFTNLSLALLLLFADSLVPKFREKKLERSPGNGQTKYNLADDITALPSRYLFSTLIVHALSTNDSARYIRTSP